jgi:hypothetical protein
MENARNAKPPRLNNARLPVRTKLRGLPSKSPNGSEAIEAVPSPNDCGLFCSGKLTAAFSVTLLCPVSVSTLPLRLSFYDLFP